MKGRARSVSLPHELSEGLGVIAGAVREVLPARIWILKILVLEFWWNFFIRSACRSLVEKILCFVEGGGKVLARWQEYLSIRR